MGKTALEIGADTFQFFTRNPRGGSSKPFDEKDVDDLVKLLDENHFAPVLCHAPYTLNPCAASVELREYTINILKDDIFRMDHIPNALLNLHPGAHVKQGVEEGIRLIADTLNKAISPSQKTIVLLETMAGKGTEVGKTFEELRAILDKLKCPEKFGVCLDTCHVHDAGYDISSSLDDTLESFDKIIGLEKLRAIHLNDSKNPRGSRKDRHEVIGKGFIGKEALVKIINHEALYFLPFFLETPSDLSGYAEEIALMRQSYRHTRETFR